MAIDNRTTGRNYPLPHPSNLLAEDVQRLRDALTAIDGDVVALDQLIDDVVNGAPEALNTLNELAAALNDDANFASTVTTALNNRYTKTESDARYVQGVTQTENVFTGNGSQTSFTLSQAPPTRESLLVTVDGVVQPTTAYNISGTSLILSEAPANGASIRVLMLGVAGPVQSASTLSFTQAGTGAVTRTVDSKLKDWVSVKDFGAKGDGTDDYSAFAAAAAAASVIFVPKGTYVVNNEVAIADNQTWIFDGATLKHTDDTKTILRANGKTGFSLLGKCVLEGTLTVAATAAETGLYITNGKRYRVEGVEARKFKGKGIWLDGSTAGALRGDRGQFTDCAAYECTVGVQVDAGAGAEYNTWTNTNISGCITGMIMAAGNNTVVGGSVVDNTNGVRLNNGPNHCHGMFIGVNINHNTTYNLHSSTVIYGHTFLGCHFYGNGSASGAIFFDNSKGIALVGGHLDCWVYNYSGASSGYNYIKNMYCPGSYGDIKRLNALASIPAELIIQGCDGPGAYDSGTSINDPGPVYVNARRLAAVTQSISSHTTLVFPSVLLDRRAAYNSSTGEFTVPAGQAGQYRIIANLYFSGTAMSATSSYVEVLINNGSPRLYLLTPYGTTILTATISQDMTLAAADVVIIKATIGGTTPVFGGASWTSSLSIHRIA